MPPLDPWAYKTQTEHCVTGAQYRAWHIEGI